jgi:hypothetical protein
MAQRTKAERDRWEQRFTALEKALEELRGGLVELRAEVLGDASAPAAPARPASVTVGAPAAAPAAAASVARKPAASAGPDERMAAFLDAFYKAKGQRLPARDVARMAADFGFDNKQTASFFLSDHPLLKVDGADRVLTMAGRKVYSEKRHLVG